MTFEIEKHIDTLVARVVRETEERVVERVREVLVDSDSKLSLLRHRGGIQWGTIGMCESYEVDAVIGNLRSIIKSYDTLPCHDNKGNSTATCKHY